MVRVYGRAAGIGLVLLLAIPLCAKNRGMLRVEANVTSSILLTATDASGLEHSQGGLTSTAVTLNFVPGQTTTFQTRALVANNPGSQGYKLVALLMGQASGVTLDGIPVATNQQVVVGEMLPYRQDSQHVLASASTDPVTILLVAQPQ